MAYSDDFLISRYKRTVFMNKAAAETARLALIRLVEEEVFVTAGSSTLSSTSSSTSSSTTSTSSSSSSMESAEATPSTFRQKMKKLR